MMFSAPSIPSGVRRAGRTALLDVRGLRKEYQTPAGSTLAVEDASFSVRKGSVFTLVGPSGCGKTTILRSLAGLENPDRGIIEAADRTIFDAERRINVPPHQRNMGMVFQSYALWPHMSVQQAVAFPLKQKGQNGKELRRRVEDMLDLVGLAELGRKYPHELSGGQQQRVALARSLVGGADLLLLDEPFSNLDARLRDRMRGELKTIQRQVGTTFLYVTHDQKEALTLSDQIAVLENGVIQQIGPPEEVYHRPNTRFVAQFLGDCNLYEMEAQCSNGWAEGDSPLGRVRSAYSQVPQGGLISGFVGVRPEHVEVAALGTQLPESHIKIPGTVSALVFCGSHVEVTLHFGAQRTSEMIAWVRTTSALPFVPGDDVVAHMSADTTWFVR